MEKAIIEAKFNKLTQVEYKHGCEIIKNCALEELEALLLFISENDLRYSRNSMPERVKEITLDIISERFCLLRDKFKPTEKNAGEIFETSNKFLKVWEESFSMVKTMVDALYERESDKNSFIKNYTFKIKLHPEIVSINSRTGEPEYQANIYDVMSYFINDIDLYIDLCYDPATRDENDFWDDIHISKKTNWNDSLDAPDVFKDYYISYSVHELYEHNNWTLQDIAKINNIDFDIKLEYRRF